jgi:hypothetical protein
MKKIIHYAFKRTITPDVQQIVYTCNWAVRISEDKITTKKDKVTCKNCLRIIKNCRFKDDAP